jgi:hypothetical protein
MPTATERLNVRREAIGAATDTETLGDSDIDYYWNGGGAGNVLLTAALCCEMLAAHAGGVEVAELTAGDLTINRTVQPAQLRQRARELRLRWAFGDAVAAIAIGASMPVLAEWADNPDAFGAAVDEFG